MPAGRFRPAAAVVAEDVSLGLGEEIHLFDVSRLKPDHDASEDPSQPHPRQALLTNLQHIASYTWLNETIPVPALAVPGMAPIWREPAVGLHLPRDRMSDIGQKQDADSVPQWPLLALVAAVRCEQPSYPLHDLDVITARNSLRRLLRWIRSDGKRGGAFEFRIDVDVVGKRTLLLSRRELRDNEHHVRGPHGHGLAFERAATYSSDADPDGEGNSYMRFMGYNRILRYNLDGLAMLVRCEVDACVRDEMGAPGSHNAAMPSASSLAEDGTVHSLTDDMARVHLSHVPTPSSSPLERAFSPSSTSTFSEGTTLFSLYGNPSGASSMSSVEVSSTIGEAPLVDASSSTKKSTALPPSEPIRVINQGHRIDQRDLVELTTCFNEHFPRWDEISDQLFLSGISRLHVGFYDRKGVLTAVRKYSPGHYRLVTARKKHAESYVRLAQLLREIRDCALQHRDVPLSLACLDGRLCMYQRMDGKTALPMQYIASFHH
ncbi:hypothetical protein EXIGLDRAFT_717225 [Exidia glandulosa HHB12029]|uniref:Uncharacterized protein n=1 Tax=Exidia glandulosa HHB12029 TaxID=1314781 RepID=A0A165P4N8_EXIGL|nr:hypothetical protein EXIGLDRAFT_717225 [Exidia glandulosa HHB12029]